MGKCSDWPPIDSDCAESFYQLPVAPSSCYYFLLCSVLSSSRYDSAISGQFREHSGNNFAAVSHFACNCQCVFLRLLYHWLEHQTLISALGGVFVK